MFAGGESERKKKDVHTVAEEDGGHGGQDGEGEGEPDVALLLGLDGLRQRGGSHRRRLLALLCVLWGERQWFSGAQLKTARFYVAGNTVQCSITRDAIYRQGRQDPGNPSRLHPKKFQNGRLERCTGPLGSRR